MENKEIINGLKNNGLDFIYNNYQKMDEFQKREIIISSLYILGNNGLLFNENTVKNTLIDELENCL